MDYSRLRIQINKQQKYSFVSTLIFGLIAHGTMLFNKLSNRDDLRMMFSGGATFSLGRWMLFVVEKIKNILFQDSVYNIPVINGFIVICCIGASLCLLIDLFEIHSIYLCILLSGIMISIPVVTATFGYMFTAQFYGIALFLAILGPYLILRNIGWKSVIVGIILMTSSVGIYQAYIPVMVSVFLFWLIKQISEAESKSARIIVYKKTLVIAFCLAGFLALYAIITVLSVKLSGVKLSAYKGIGSVSKVPLIDYFQRILFAYTEFFQQREGSFYNIFPGGSRTLFHISVVTCIIFFIIYCYWIRKQTVSLLLTIILSLFIPLAINFIFVMVDETYCNALMVYGYGVFFIFFAWISEKVLSRIKPFFSDISKVFIICILSLMVFVFIRFDNLCYMRLTIVQSQTTRYYSTLITRIQSTPGYNASMKIAYIGDPQTPDWDTTIPEIKELNYIRTHPYFGFRELMKVEPWRNFMEIWLNFKAWEADSKDFLKHPKVKDMPCYPNDGSIKIIDGTMIVKFSEHPD